MPRSFAFAVAFAIVFTIFLPAAAQQPSQDPPARIARLNAHDGTVSFSPAGDDSWYDVVPNRPITSGDRLWTDRDSRAEVFIGSTAVRTDARSSLEFTQIDDSTVQLTLMQGSLDLHIHDDLDGQRFEVDTGNLALVILTPGDYRIDADPAAGTTRVAVAVGSATVYGENGAPLPLGPRQQITVSGRDLGTAATRVPQTAAAFDRWVGERNLIDERSASARFVSRDVVGYQQLDAHGDWRTDASYGSVWYPRNVAADWAPYQQGQWIDVAPWGWTWVDSAPWGFAPSHYGRWARVGPRWGWVPGRIDARPVFAPALVGFVGGPGPGTGTGGRNGVGWFPLAPGERWQPGFRASQRYVDRVNRTIVSVNGPLQRNDVYVNQRIGPAVTMVPAERFGRGPIERRDFMRPRDDSLSRAPVAFAPPLTLAAGAAVGGVALGALRTRPAAAVPPPMLQPRAPMAQLAPIQPIQPRTQIYSTQGSAQQQRQQQADQLDRRREEQQQLQQQALRDQNRRATAQQEQQHRDLQRQQENRVNAAREQQEQDRQRQVDQRQDQQRHDQQREQEQRLQMQRAERDRQEQNRQTQFRQEQQRQIQQQEQRQAQQDFQQRATQLRAQEQSLQQQRQQDRQHQQQQQASRLQDIQRSQERANEQRRDDQRRQPQR